MDSTAQHMPDGLPPCPVPDLRKVPLQELASQAGRGDGVIDAIVARMVDGGESSSLAPVTRFNSAI